MLKYNNISLNIIRLLTSSETLPNSDPHSPFLTGWITAMHYSLEPLARASKGSSMCKTALLGSGWQCEVMNTSHPSYIHFIGFPSLPGLTTRSTSSLDNAFMATPLRLTNSHHLHPPRTKFRTLGDWAFCSANPRLWNSLPDYLRAPQTVECF